MFDMHHDKDHVIISCGSDAHSDSSDKSNDNGDNDKT